MSDFFHMIFIQPISWLLMTCYNLFDNYGMAIILFTIITKVILLPLSYKAKYSMMQTGKLQPKIAEIQKMYKDNKAKQQEEMGKLYKERGINPLGGCLWSLLPFPILIGLYFVISNPISNLMHLDASQIMLVANLVDPAHFTSVFSTGVINELHLAQSIHDNYALISQLPNVVPNFPAVQNINFMFMGVFNLSVVPSLAWQPLVIIPFLAGAAAWFSTWISQKTSMQVTPAGGAGMVMKLMPLISVYFGFVLPAGLGVYWIVNSLLSIVQDMYISKIVKKKFAEEDAKQEEIQRKRKEAEHQAKQEAIRKREESIQEQKKNAGKRPQSSKYSNKSKKKPAPRSRQDFDERESEDADLDGSNNTVSLSKANDGELNDVN